MKEGQHNGKRGFRWVEISDLLEEAFNLKYISSRDVYIHIYTQPKDVCEDTKESQIHVWDLTRSSLLGQLVVFLPPSFYSGERLPRAVYPLPIYISIFLF